MKSGVDPQNSSSGAEPRRKYPLRARRLDSPDMYRRVKTEGTVLRKFPLSMRTLQADDIQDSRIGFVIPKRTGNAPLRNAMRRVLRELFNHRSESFARPAWVVFDVSSQAAGYSKVASEPTRAGFRGKADALLLTLCGDAA